MEKKRFRSRVMLSLKRNSKSQNKNRVSFPKEIPTLKINPFRLRCQRKKTRFISLNMRCLKGKPKSLFKNVLVSPRNTDIKD